ncbi:hypothetical protein HELRODRAFT_65375, partial [Helobdella robusta]|uniref:Cytochrome b/b6 N-terminal region profile domain-containing protein n=1 Tax=Helobdella robusta TaxID=6412 RepID=T1FY68_HELRO
LLRYLHANGASIFFLFLYLHIGRGSYMSANTLILLIIFEYLHLQTNSIY